MFSRDRYSIADSGVSVRYQFKFTYLLHGAESSLRSLLVLQLVKKFSAFLEPEGSSPYSQVPATCPFPEPTPSSPHNPLPLPEDPSTFHHGYKNQSVNDVYSKGRCLFWEINHSKDQT